MFTKRGEDAAGLKIDVHFLPEIDFANVWNTPDISDKTRETIMKYLQLILFSIITNVSDQNSFGDTAKLFEAINEDELKGKLDETFKNMQDLFAGMGGMGAAGEAGEAGEHMKGFEKMAEQFNNFMPEGIDMSKVPNFNFDGDGDGADAEANAGANTGDGGGGTSTINSAGPAWAGGSGIVIIAFPNIYPVPTLSGLSYTEPTRAGYRVYRIYGGSGTFTFN